MKLILLALITALFFQTEKTIKIELTVPQTQTVLKALQKLPYEESADIIHSIINQANKQLDSTSKK